MMAPYVTSIRLRSIPKRMINLIDNLTVVWQQVRQELAAFTTFLTDLSRADEE